jgi:hypothetical protein
LWEISTDALSTELNIAVAMASNTGGVEDFNFSISEAYRVLYSRRSKGFFSWG